MKYNLFLLLTSATWMFLSCSPEDRSDEQPFPPSVETLEPLTQGDTITLQGNIKASPNSRITQRGFRYGDETLRNNILSTDSSDIFTAAIDTLKSGTYHVAAYATNGMGTSYGDTLQFVVE